MKKTCRIWWATAVLLATGMTFLRGADQPPAEGPPPPVPSDVQLRNGKVLHRVTVLRWEKDRVVLKHAGGADPVRYVDLADSQKAAIMARGQYELDHPAAPRQAALVPNTDGAEGTIVYTGVIYVPTLDHNILKNGKPEPGIYKFSGITVYAFPLAALSAFEGNRETVELPKPLVTATTNADGVFTLSVPADVPHFIFCEARRVVSGGYENCAWRLLAKDLKNPQGLELSTRYRVPYRQLRIAN